MREIEEKSKILKTTMMHFNENLRTHCLKQCIDDCPDCASCSMRLYCFTAPCARTDDLVYNSIKSLNHLDYTLDDIDKETHAYLDHYKIYEPIAPGPLDMLNAPNKYVMNNLIIRKEVR